MFGFRRNRTAARPSDPKPFRHLRPNERYRVARAFVDHDDILHPVGETWTFLESSFLPYEDGLSLFVATPDGVRQQIRLQWRPEAEGAVIDALGDYLTPMCDDAASRMLLLTRDSVCLADDVDAPHWSALKIACDADAVAIARAALAAGVLAWVGSNATWTLAIGPDRVVFGYRHGLRFARSMRSAPLTARAGDIDRLHLRYLAQIDPNDVAPN